jgi:hypothetical protein
MAMEKKKVFKVSAVFIVYFYALIIEGPIWILTLPFMLFFPVYYICKERKKVTNYIFPLFIHCLS